MQDGSLRKLRNADILHKKIVAMSSRFLVNEEIEEIDRFKNEANIVLNGVKGTDVVIAIFDHLNYTPVLEVGAKEFWGELPEVAPSERMSIIMSLLEEDYLFFYTDSVKWFTEVLEKVPLEHRENIQIFHCGIRYRLLNDKSICLFSKGLPLHVDKHKNFRYTFNFVQNVNHLLKKDFRDYWIRLSYGTKGDFLHTFHSQDKLYATKDLLSVRQKEILKLISEDCDTKEIAERLFISTATVGNHRSNMIERLGARDTTALVQLAKMADMI